MRRFLFFSLAGFMLMIFIPCLIIYFGVDRDIIKVYVTDEDVVREMNREQYLKEVVSAEMPAEFNTEALKAQAIAARTYLKSREKKSFDEHKGAVICTDYRHCKAWISEKDRKEQWEEDKRDGYWEKISRSVDETRDKYIMYNGEVIEALFHSTSSGNTENAGDVWGKDVPYLVSVKSEGEEFSPKYKSQKNISEEEFKNKISEKYENADWSEGLFCYIVRSGAGGIKSLKCGGVTVSGTDLRTLFELRSTNIEITKDGENIKFDVTGNGHGVGMSQYGANYLASNGMSCEDILKHYYTGVEIA